MYTKLTHSTIDLIMKIERVFFLNVDDHEMELYISMFADVG